MTRPPAFRPLLSLWPVMAAAGFLLAAALAPVPSAHADDAPATLDLSAYRGKVVYLDFWASWCQPCKQSFPFMEQLKATYGDQGLVIIAVNVDHSPAKAKAFQAAMGSDLPVVYDTSGDLAAHFRVTDMPTSILIGRDGKTRYLHNGFHPEQTMTYASQVAELIHEH